MKKQFYWYMLSEAIDYLQSTPLQFFASNGMVETSLPFVEFLSFQNFINGKQWRETINIQFRVEFFILVRFPLLALSADFPLLDVIDTIKKFKKKRIINGERHPPLVIN